MKIVHVIYCLQVGGAETMLVDIVNEQAKTNEVSLVIINNQYSKELLATINKDVNVILYNRVQKRHSPWAFIKLNWFLMRHKPDVVHVHNESILSVITKRCAKGMFLTAHTTGIEIKNKEKISKIFAIADVVKDDLLKQGELPVITIANGVNIDLIKKRGNNNLRNNELRIIQVARFGGYKKGQDILIKAVSLLKQRGLTNIKVDFIGYGNSEDCHKELANELGVSKQINFLGMRNRDYIYSHLKDYDLMCHPARIEGFGLTVAEGIAAMLPVLVPNANGPYEIIDKGKFGFVFEKENVTDCADKIEYIYNNYNQCYKITSLAYNKVCKEYSIEFMVKTYLESYANTIENN